MVCQGADYLAYYGREGEYEGKGGFKLHGPEAEGQEAFNEGKNCVSTMDIRHNLEVVGSEGGTRKKAHS